MWVWTQTKRQALEQLMEDRLTDAAIAAELGIGARTLCRWKARPEFRQAMDDHLAAWRQAYQRASEEAIRAELAYAIPLFAALVEKERPANGIRFELPTM